MRKTKKFIPLIAAFLFILSACGGKDSKETAASIAKKWCDLNAQVFKAADGPAKEAATTARKKFETEMQEKYKDNKSFMEEVGKEVEKCEDASEGR